MSDERGRLCGRPVAIGARPIGALPDEAQDALRDAFAKALARNEHFSRPEGWLFVVASRLWRQTSRCRGDRQPLSPLAKSVLVGDAGGSKF